MRSTLTSAWARPMEETNKSGNKAVFMADLRCGNAETLAGVASAERKPGYVQETVLPEGKLAMSRFDIESWCKKSPTDKSEPMGQMSFHISENDHLNLEQAEERLQNSGEPEAWVDVDMTSFQLVTPPEC